MRDNRLYGTLRYIIALCAFGLLGFASCEKQLILLDQPNEDIRSLGGFIGNNFDYMLFAAALEYTGLMDTLANSPGPFTVLAPPDAAFNDLGITRISDFYGMDRDSLRDVLAYHILPFRLMEADVPENSIDQRYMTLAGRALYSSRAINATTNIYVTERSHLYFSGAYVRHKDWEFSNGLMHTLTKLMKPHPGKTVQDLLASRPQYSTLVAGFKKFGLWDELATEGPFTVFAAQNSFLAEYGITEASIAAMDASQYIGERLFGAYIMYGKHYFTLDNGFFLWSEGQGWLVNPLRNDPGYYQILMSMDNGSNMYDYPNLQRRAVNLTRYSLGISAQTYPYGYYLGSTSSTAAPSYMFNQANFLGKSSQVYGTGGINTGTFPYLNDHLCGNGLVHDIQSTLVLPQEALR